MKQSRNSIGKEEIVNYAYVCQLTESSITVRYAIISDVHGNLPALEQVIGLLEDRDVGQYLCLGDVVGYGASPNECCQLIQQIEAVCIRGNHDEGAVSPAKEQWFNPEARACLIWTRQQLTEDNRRWLKSLEPTTQVDDMVLCHGSIPDPDHYTITARDASYSFQATSAPLIFFGHTHYAEWFTYQSGEAMPVQHQHPEGGTCAINEQARYLINPGSVGQPRDRNNQASFAIYDDQQPEVAVYRTPYDIQAAQQMIFDADLPAIMAWRLSWGI